MSAERTCEAICAATGKRCTSRTASYRVAGRRACGRHRRAHNAFVPPEQAVPTMTVSEHERQQLLVVETCRSKVEGTEQRAASAIVAIVREADWLRRRLYWDRGIR